MARFIDKMVVGLNKGITSVSEGSKLIVEKATLNTKIIEVEKEKKDLIFDLGSLVYNLYESGKASIPECSDLCGQILERVNFLKEMQEQLQTIKNQDAAEAQENQTIPATQKTCGCGTVNSPDSKFCVKCGKAL